MSAPRGGSDVDTSDGEENIERYLRDMASVGEKFAYKELVGRLGLDDADALLDRANVKRGTRESFTGDPGQRGATPRAAGDGAGGGLESDQRSRHRQHRGHEDPAWLQGNGAGTTPKGHGGPQATISIHSLPSEAAAALGPARNAGGATERRLAGQRDAGDRRLSHTEHGATNKTGADGRDVALSQRRGASHPGS